MTRIVLVLVAIGTASLTAQNLPGSPGEAELARQRELFRATYAAELAAAAGDIGRRGDLAVLLLQRADQTKDAVARSVLLDEAKALALAAGDCGTAYAIVRREPRSADGDPLGDEISALRDMASRVKGENATWQVVQLQLQLAGTLRQQQQWDRLAEVTDIAARTAGTLGDAGLVREAAAWCNLADELQRGQQPCAAAEAALQANDRSPADVQRDRSIVGRQHLLAGQQGALDLVVLGTDRDWSEAAAALRQFAAAPPTAWPGQPSWLRLLGKETQGAAFVLRQLVVTSTIGALEKLAGKDLVELQKTLATLDPAPAAPKDKVALVPAAWVVKALDAQNRWQSLPPGESIRIESGSVLRARHASANGGGIKVVLRDRVFAGDCTLWCEIKGGLETIELTSADQERSLFLRNPSTVGKWAAVVLQRQGTLYRAWVDGVPQPFCNYNAPPQLEGLLTLRMSSGIEANVRNLRVRGGRPTAK